MEILGVKIERKKEAQQKTSKDPDRYELKIKEGDQWVKKDALDEPPKDEDDIPESLFEPGRRIAVYDTVEKRYLSTIKIPGKKKGSDEGGEKKEKKDLIEKAGEDLERVGGAFEKIGTGISKIQQSAASLTGGNKEIVDAINALREDLKGGQSQGQGDMRQLFRDEMNYVKDMALMFGFGQSNSHPNIPPEIAAKLPGWSLMMYYPPIQAIQELKEGIKEVTEHAIRVAKGEIPESGNIGAGVDEGESVLERLKRKKQQQAAGAGG